MSRNSACDLLRSNLDRHPGKAACLFENVVVDYAGLWADSCRFGNLLRQHGVKRGERVLIVLPDTPAFPFAFFGSLLIGACPVPVNTSLTVAEYSFLLEDSGAVVRICPSGHAVLAAEAPGLRVTLLCDAFGPPGLSGMAPALEPCMVGDDDVALILYSSGSTGQPKGVPHRPAALSAGAGLWGGPVLGLSDTDVVLSSSKLFFSYGLIANLLLPMGVGATTILHPGRPTPHDLFALIARHRPTVFFGVPTTYGQMIQSYDATARIDSLRLFFSCGEALPEIIYSEWRALTGIELLDGIGSTEVLNSPISNRPRRSLAGSCGEVVPGYDIRIVDDDGADVSDGAVGHLLVRGDSVCRGYWNRQDATAKTMLADGWLRTGDVVERRDGRYFHHGRSDDMMKIGGMWVPPNRVEETLRGHRAVVDCAVVARSSGGLDRIYAFVILRTDSVGTSALGQELRRHVLGRLPNYMCPLKIEFVTELPRTTTGKVQRFKLRGGQ
ncbi:MAG TPA: benzoate-CoA ligase family protein [Telmatospirillum sp.]|nr:benzoate-CoA ligase family protein [Telmatospirillum sp.]